MRRLIVDKKKECSRLGGGEHSNMPVQATDFSYRCNDSIHYQQTSMHQLSGYVKMAEGRAYGHCRRIQ
jgi:hypothetical protein